MFSLFLVIVEAVLMLCCTAFLVLTTRCHPLTLLSGFFVCLHFAIVAGYHHRHRHQVVERKYSTLEGLLADVALMYSNAQAIKHEQVIPVLTYFSLCIWPKSVRRVAIFRCLEGF